MHENDDRQTDQIIDFVRDLSYFALPQSTIAAGRVAVLDCIGCMFGGRSTNVAEQALRVIEVLGGHEAATIVGHGRRTSVELAAFINAVQANALDYDDAFEHDGKGMGHPGATIVPTALAMAET